MKENRGKLNNHRDNGENLMEKAKKMMLDYTQATGSSVCIYDSAYTPLYPGGTDAPESTICPYCVNFRQEGFPCQNMHINAIKESNKKGGSHIYQCDLGLLFWTSPIYTEGSFSGAIRGSGFLPAAAGEQDTGQANDKKTKKCQKSVDISSNANNTLVMCNSEISEDEFKRRASSFPGADIEKVQSLAEMTQLCAESLSSGEEDYHEILRRRAEQQEAIAKNIEELKKKHPGNEEKPGYPMDKERMLLASLRRGDCAEAKKITNELMAMLIFSNPGQFKYVQLRVTELVVLLSRVEISPAKSGNLSMETNSRTLKQVQEAKTIEELTDILHTILDRVSGVISSFKGIPHAAALRKAESFIMENFTRKISLKEIAAVAGLSAPYFSTIFKDEMGENLSKYLNRLRVEKASRLLLETDMSLSEIAGCCCFEDQSWFSKIFKAYTGVSPGKYRNQGGGLVKNNVSDTLPETFLTIRTLNK